MCNTIIRKDEFEIETFQQFVNSFPDIDIILYKWTHKIKATDCLCGVDIEETLKNAKIKYEISPMGFDLRIENEKL